MIFLYALTLFVSAFLLFWIQPMFGKMVLPLLGSTPNVWNTCVVFFQIALLSGYIYAYISTNLLGVKKQSLLHAILLFLPLLVLPVSIPQTFISPQDKNPILWLLLLMTVSLGFPFFVVSSSAPMLQKWFSQAGHKTSKDPYFLYAASNLGSMFGLLSYPIILEPLFKLFEQSKLWTICYGLLILLTLVCAVVLWKSKNIHVESDDPLNTNSKITVKNRLHWIILSFVPSSLLLGVTTYISTDIASVPLLWIVPLLIYLLSFVLAFAKHQIISHELMVTALPALVLPVMIYIVSTLTKVLWLTFLLHLLCFFTACMVCNGELAKNRPNTKYLTEFYLLISFGGVLGGLFNIFIAPLIFKKVLEYPMALVLACLLRPSLIKAKNNYLLDLIFSVLLGILIIAIYKALGFIGFCSDLINNLIALGIPALICYSFEKRPIRFGLALAVIMFVNIYLTSLDEKVLSRDRSFFGIHKVILSSDGKFHALMHGNTLHGKESTDPKRRHEPISYYYSTGPIGQLFSVFNEMHKDGNIGIAGLGTGTLLSYATPNQSWFIFEIDPTILKVASNEKYFTFLTDCLAKNKKVILGDARLSIKKTQDKYFDLFIFDAFSSDSIPIHLITKEAVELYFKKLKDDGLAVFHISNRHLDLEPILAVVANACNLVSFVQYDYNITSYEKEMGKDSSVWVILVKDKSNLAKLVSFDRWQELKPNPKLKVWSDDYSNILSVLNWGKV